MRAVPWQVSTAQHERLAVVVFGIASDMPAKWEPFKMFVQGRGTPYIIQNEKTFQPGIGYVFFAYSWKDFVHLTLKECGEII